MVICHSSNMKLIHPSTIQAVSPECWDSGGVGFMVDLEASKSRGNDCSHSELFWKDLQNLTSSTSPLVPIGTSLILPFLDNLFHKEIDYPFYLSFSWPSCCPPAFVEMERSCERDHHHESSAWVETDVEWQHHVAVCSDASPFFSQDGSLDPTLKWYELRVMPTLVGWVILTLSCHPSPNTPNVLSSLDEWMDL